jgi:hypothetical protein
MLIALIVGRLAALAVLASLAPLSGRSPECLPPPPPCEALQRYSVVLVADVIDATDSWDRAADKYRPQSQHVRLRVVEAFKGVPAETPEITADIVNVSAEDIFLRKGQKYLVFAFRRADGRWQTTCSLRTRPVKKDDEEIGQLRACARSP